MPQDLIREYRRIGKLGGNFRGLSILNHAEEIARLPIWDYVSKVLDYGSGAGDQYGDPHRLHEQWGLSRLSITLFDPAFKGIHVRPDKTRFDLIICSDVLEHLQEGAAQEAVYWMAKHAKIAVWASVCCRPAKKLFDDGTNMHVTVRPLEWWRKLFDAAFTQDGLDRRSQFWLVETP